MVAIPVDHDILLRTYTPKDADILFEAVDRNRSHLRTWLPWVDATIKPEHSLAFIEHSLTQSDNQEGIALGIFRKEELIGGLGMMHWNHDLRKAQIGYWISKEYEGSGTLSLCLERFLDFLFNKLQLNKIEIHFVTTNTRSAAIAKKFGAIIEGVLRESYLLHGKTEDLIITGILNREWENRTR